MESILQIFSVSNILIIIAGVTLGIIFGAIPGLSSTTGVALMFPFSFVLDPIPATLLMLSVYFGGMSGGLIPAILLKIPGTPASVATTLDGYPLAQKGFASRALGVGVCASFFGGLLSAILLIAFSGMLGDIAVGFSPFDYFGVAFFALMMMIAVLDSGFLKGVIALALGVLLSCVGASPIDGVLRFAPSSSLSGGFQLMSVVIGVFAVAEMLKNTNLIGGGAVKPIQQKISLKSFFLKPSEWKKYFPNLMGAGLIGTISGVLPGLGGSAGSMMSYITAKRMSKNGEQFGKGAEEGIIASEAANNAVTGGALIPMMALGVPGDTATALIMAALAVQGISSGPVLFQQNPEIVNTVLFSSIVINIILFIIASFALRFLINVTKIPTYYLLPIVIVFCVIGCYSVNFRMFDVYAMLAFGYIGYILDRNGYSLTPLIIGLILGPMIELNVRRAMIYSQGDFVLAMSDSIVGSVFMIAGIVLPIIIIAGSSIMKKRKESAALAAQTDK